MTDMTRDEALRLRIIEAAVEWAGQKAGEPFEGDERKALELTAAKALTLMERETEALSRPAPAPGSAEVEALCERLLSMTPASGSAPTENYAPYKAADMIRALDAKARRAFAVADMKMQRTAERTEALDRITAERDALATRVEELEVGVSNIEGKANLAVECMDDDKRGQTMARAFKVIADYARALLNKEEADDDA